MRCYFLRHGIAVDPEQWPGKDFDRPLTGEGRARMGREAKTIAELDLNLDVIVTSPLERAKQTAAIVAEKLKLQDRLVEDSRLGLGFEPSRLGEVLRAHPGAGAMLLVGHEPGMSLTIGRVVGGARIDFKKGSLACVSFTDPSSLTGELAWLVPPKLLAL
ncbi:MAG: histidine phosphatase family protein [Candidatus Tumulicola sp.]